MTTVVVKSLETGYGFRFKLSVGALLQFEIPHEIWR